MSEALRPQVGIGIFLIKGDKILLGRRKGSHGQGEYALPGGHLELGESFEDCVRRELNEEVGDNLKIGNIKFLCVTNLRKYAPKHYADIGMLVEYKSGVPNVEEPEKIDGWNWHSINDLPSPLFGCTNNYVEAYRSGKSYFEN